MDGGKLPLRIGSPPSPPWQRWVFGIAVALIVTASVRWIGPANAALMALAVAIPCYAFFRVFSSRTTADAEGIRVRSYIGKTRRIPWSDVAEIHVGSARGWATTWDRVRIRAEPSRRHSLWIERVDGTAVRIRSLRFHHLSERRQRAAADALNELRVRYE